MSTVGEVSYFTFHPLGLRLADFEAETHAARYLPVLAAHPEATTRLLALLNDRRSEQLMIHESERGNAALRGVAIPIETDPLVFAALTDDDDGPRYRQAVGVAIRLKMEQLGWSTTGRKGPVGGSTFNRAEKYVLDPSTAIPYAERVRAGLARIATIGTEEERRESGDRLQEALRATRAEEGRPF